MTTATEVTHVDPEILGATPVFIGARVAVESLFEYIEAGESPDELLRQFPLVKREQVIAALEIARDARISLWTFLNGAGIRRAGLARLRLTAIPPPQVISVLAR